MIGFDPEAWLESEDYRKWQQMATQQVVVWGRAQVMLDSADAAAQRGDRAACLAALRDYVDATMLPYLPSYPPEVHTDPAYRERWVTSSSWWMLQDRFSEEVSAHNEKMTAAFAAIDWADPLPALREGVVHMRSKLDAGFGLGPPEDPDGMPPPARERLSIANAISYYAASLDSRQRVAILREIHGEQNVIVDDSTPHSGDGGWMDFQCPRCGLVMITPNTLAQAQCLGCYRQFPLGADYLELPACDLPCVGCASMVTIPQGAHDARCPACDAVVRRVGRSGRIDREVQAEQHGATPTLPPEGEGGIEVTADNRQQLVVSGLAMVASMYAAFVSPPRYLDLLRRSTADGQWPPPGEILDAIEKELRDDEHTEDRAFELIARVRGG
jgi:LSD1 subclass zinc finger protein